MIIPEIPINEITQVDVDEYANQQVDLYLPQAYLIIEIDGSQHEKDKQKDIIRDLHTAKYGIQTVRIKTADLESENEVFFQKIAEIKAPNVFTPDGDGINDKFHIINLEMYPDAIVTIYNRWGHRLYRRTHYHEDEWDGGNVSDGVYYYIIELEKDTERGEGYSGVIHLIRNK